MMGEMSFGMWLLKGIYALVWSPMLLILLLGVGIYLTIALRGIQFRYIRKAFQFAFGKQEDNAEGDISHFQSLMTALAATCGIGNIAGVATAVTMGGVGALFWMWIMAVVGMAMKYAEAVLAVKYRCVDKKGEMSGGPMYFIEKGLGWKWMAMLFAFFGILVSLGGGNMLQANSVADVLRSHFNIDPLWSGIAMAALTGLILLGGIKSIGNVAGWLVPLMAVLYVAGGGVILILNAAAIPGALMAIVSHAFTGQAAFGGFVGATMMMALQVGLARGLMTSEAGLGTASIAAAAAKTGSSVRQGLVSMTSCLLTTVLMCTITALVLQVTGVVGSVDVNGKVLNGAPLTVAAFETVFSYGAMIVAVSIVLFGFTTIIGYAYYAEKCLEYLVGEWSIPYYRVVFTGFVALGAVLQLEVVWMVSDIANGLMAYPNLIGLLALSSVVVKETRSWVASVEAEEAMSEPQPVPVLTQE